MSSGRPMFQSSKMANLKSQKQSLYCMIHPTPRTHGDYRSSSNSSESAQLTLVTFKWLTRHPWLYFICCWCNIYGQHLKWSTCGNNKHSGRPQEQEVFPGPHRVHDLWTCHLHGEPYLPLTCSAHDILCSMCSLHSPRHFSHSVSKRVVVLCAISISSSSFN